MGQNSTNKPHQDQLPDWEAICERCGRCCYEKYQYRGKILYTDTPCQYLDPRTRQCRVYIRRTKVHPDCVQLTPELVAAGILPADCPYVRQCGQDAATSPTLSKKKHLRRS